MCKLTDNKFIPCRNCPNRSKGGPMLGYYYDKLNGFDIVKECDCHRKWRLEQEFNRELILSNINPDYTLDNYVGTKSINDIEALKTILMYPDKFIYKKMIYIYGPNGCQKTTMCQALGKELIKKGYSVQYQTMNEIITALVQSFDDPNQEQKDYLIQRCSNCDFLIIDESFDIKKVTLYNSGFQIPFLDNFIRSRFDINKKTIIFISNKKQDMIAKEGFGASMESLIERNTRQSTLFFNDVWVENANKIDRFGLFK